MRAMPNVQPSSHLQQSDAALLDESVPFARIDALNAEAWALSDQDAGRAAALAEEALALACGSAPDDVAYPIGIAEALTKWLETLPDAQILVHGPVCVAVLAVI